MIEGNVKRFRWVALAVPIIVLAMAAPAPAAEKEHHPLKEYARFTQCPTEASQVALCIFAEAYGGEFQIGNVDTPITKPLVLQGGLRKVVGDEYEAIPASNGESLVKAPQVVPGGIFALVKEGRYPWYLRNFCKNFSNNSECMVTATPEVVGPPTLDLGAVIGGVGTALTMPLRLHLKNPFLGGKCYLGSTSNPIALAFTDGTEPPLGIEPELEGQVGHFESLEEVLADYGSEDVDNAYSAPGVEGCGGPQSLVVDREIDEKQALPSPAGHNRARLIGTNYLATAEEVSKSEA